MNILNIVSQIAPNIIGGTGIEGGPVGGLLGEVFELIGIQNPEALAGAGSGPGSIINALLQSVGFDSEIAQVVGIVADAGTGNIPGAVAGGSELLGDGVFGADSPATDVLSLARFVKV